MISCGQSYTVVVARIYIQLGVGSGLRSSLVGSLVVHHSVGIRVFSNGPPGFAYHLLRGCLGLHFFLLGVDTVR